MNFIEAFDIVNKYNDVIATKGGCTPFIRYSSIRETTDRLYDAFIIFYGHTVAYNTVSPQQLQNYLFISQFIQNIVDDDVYELAESSMSYLNNLKTFDKLFRKKDIADAESRFNLCLNIATNRYNTFHNSENAIDFNVYVSKLVEMKQYYVANQDILNFNDFLEQYLDTVYSHTTQKTYDDGDYMLFRPFKVLKNDVLTATGKDAEFYQKYKNTIMMYG